MSSIHSLTLPLRSHAVTGLPPLVHRRGHGRDGVHRGRVQVPAVRVREPPLPREPSDASTRKKNRQRRTNDIPYFVRAERAGVAKRSLRFARAAHQRSPSFVRARCERERARRAEREGGPGGRRGAGCGLRSERSGEGVALPRPESKAPLGEREEGAPFCGGSWLARQAQRRRVPLRQK